MSKRRTTWLGQVLYWLSIGLRLVLLGFSACLPLILLQDALQQIDIAEPFALLGAIGLVCAGVGLGLYRALLSLSPSSSLTIFLAVGVALLRLQASLQTAREHIEIGNREAQAAAERSYKKYSEERKVFKEAFEATFAARKKICTTSAGNFDTSSLSRTAAKRHRCSDLNADMVKFLARGPVAPAPPPEPEGASGQSVVWWVSIVLTALGAALLELVGMELTISQSEWAAKSILRQADEPRVVERLRQQVGAEQRRSHLQKAFAEDELLAEEYKNLPYSSDDPKVHPNCKNVSLDIRRAELAEVDFYRGTYMTVDLGEPKTRRGYQMQCMTLHPDLVAKVRKKPITIFVGTKQARAVAKKIVELRIESQDSSFAAAI